MYDIASTVMMKWLIVVTKRDGMPTDSVRDMVSRARLTMWWPWWSED